MTAPCPLSGPLRLELDLFNPDVSPAGDEAARYQELFTVLLRAKKEGAAESDDVTFWSIQDEEAQAHRLPRLPGWTPCSPTAIVRRRLTFVAAVPEGDAEDRLPYGERFAFWETEARQHAITT